MERRKRDRRKSYASFKSLKYSFVSPLSISFLLRIAFFSLGFSWIRIWFVVVKEKLVPPWYDLRSWLGRYKSNMYLCVDSFIRFTAPFRRQNKRTFWTPCRALEKIFFLTRLTNRITLDNHIHVWEFLHSLVGYRRRRHFADRRWKAPTLAKFKIELSETSVVSVHI